MTSSCLSFLRLSRLAALAALALLTAPLAGAAQVVSVTVRDGVTRGDEHHAALRPAEALEAYRGVLATDSTRFDALWRAARACVHLGMLDDGGEAGAWYEAAVEFAHRAVDAAPDSARGHEWLAIALGRKALNVGPLDRVDLSGRIRESALVALELDPTAAGAHNVLGQWHAEIRRLSGLTRFTAQRLLGAETFREATWDDAERHLRQAVELQPRAPIHRLALAQVLLDLDRPAEARAELRRAVELPVEEPTDPVTLAEARALLRELEG